MKEIIDKKLIYNNKIYDNGEVDYSNIRILSGYCQALFKDTENGIRYWMENKHHRCYACGLYGHLAVHCNKICKKCYNLHYDGLCGVTLSNKINNIEKNIQRFLKTYGIELYEKEMEKIQSNLENKKEKQISEAKRIKQEFKETTEQLAKIKIYLENEKEKYEAFKKTTQNLLKKQEISQIQRDANLRAIREDEKLELELRKRNELIQLEETLKEEKARLVERTGGISFHYQKRFKIKQEQARKEIIAKYDKLIAEQNELFKSMQTSKLLKIKEVKNKNIKEINIDAGEKPIPMVKPLSQNEIITRKRNKDREKELNYVLAAIEAGGMSQYTFKEHIPFTTTQLGFKKYDMLSLFRYRDKLIALLPPSSDELGLKNKKKEECSIF